MRQSAHWAALIAALGGSLTLCRSDYALDAVQAEPGSSALCFEVADDEPDRPVFANVPGGQPAGWGSYQDCEQIGGGWYRCVWRF